MADPQTIAFEDPEAKLLERYIRYFKRKDKWDAAWGQKPEGHDIEGFAQVHLSRKKAEYDAAKKDNDPSFAAKALTKTGISKRFLPTDRDAEIMKRDLVEFRAKQMADVINPVTQPAAEPAVELEVIGTKMENTTNIDQNPTDATPAPQDAITQTTASTTSSAKIADAPVNGPMNGPVSPFYLDLSQDDTALIQQLAAEMGKNWDGALGRQPADDKLLQIAQHFVQNERNAHPGEQGKIAALTINADDGMWDKDSAQRIIAANAGIETAPKAPEPVIAPVAAEDDHNTGAALMARIRTDLDAFTPSADMGPLPTDEAGKAALADLYFSSAMAAHSGDADTFIAGLLAQNGNLFDDEKNREALALSLQTLNAQEAAKAAENQSAPEPATPTVNAATDDETNDVGGQDTSKSGIYKSFFRDFSPETIDVIRTSDNREMMKMDENGVALVLAMNPGFMYGKAFVDAIRLEAAKYGMTFEEYMALTKGGAVKLTDKKTGQEVIVDAAKKAQEEFMRTSGLTQNSQFPELGFTSFIAASNTLSLFDAEGNEYYDDGSTVRMRLGRKEVRMKDGMLVTQKARSRYNAAVALNETHMYARRRLDKMPDSTTELSLHISPKGLAGPKRMAEVRDLGIIAALHDAKENNYSLNLSVEQPVLMSKSFPINDDGTIDFDKLSPDAVQGMARYGIDAKKLVDWYNNPSAHVELSGQLAKTALSDASQAPVPQASIVSTPSPAETAPSKTFTVDQILNAQTTPFPVTGKLLNVNKVTVSDVRMPSELLMAASKAAKGEVDGIVPDAVIAADALSKLSGRPTGPRI